MAAKKNSTSVKQQLKQADKKIKGTGVTMTKKERDELLNLVPTKKKPVAKKKPTVKRK